MDRPVRLQHDTGTGSRRFQAAAAHDVENLLAAGKQVVGDDPAMAAPPYCFGTHHRTRDGAAILDQLLQSGAELG